MPLAKASTVFDFVNGNLVSISLMAGTGGPGSVLVSLDMANRGEDTILINSGEVEMDGGCPVLGL